MTGFPYRLDEMREPTLGLIVLQVDETIEQDMRQVFGSGPAKLHITRVPSGDTLTLDTIATMETRLQAAAALLPPAAQFDVIGYGCTSGTAAIGADRVRTLVCDGATSAAVTDPLTASLAAMDALGIRRVGIVSPYVASVGQPITEAFTAHGLTVVETLSFGEEIEARVARIDPFSIAEAARTLASGNSIDGLFLSCTNLRTFGIIEALGAELGLPVLSSNQVLAWHMAGLAGVTNAMVPGELLRKAIVGSGPA